MNQNLIALACIAALALAACAQQPAAPSTGAVVDETPVEAFQPAAVDVVPTGEGEGATFDQRDFAGTFTGTLPCADCPGMDVTLTLEPDGAYRTTHVYQERPDGTWTIDGHWSVESDDGVIRLDPNSKTEEDQLYSIESRERIVMLDADGNKADSGMDYGLTRQGAQ